MSRERTFDPASADSPPCPPHRGWRWYAVAAVLLCGSALAQPRLDWVALVAGKAAPPLNLAPDVMLAVRIESVPPGNLTLHLRAFPAGASVGGPRDLPSLALAQLTEQAVGKPSERLVPLPLLDRQKIAQFEAWLVDGQGRRVSRTAALTLDAPAAAALAPTAMQRLLDRGGGLLNELTRLYGVVRTDGGVARHYTVALNTAGVPSGKLVAHDLPRGTLSQLAASPTGRYAAWAVVDGASATIWLAVGAEAAQPFWSGAAPVAGPVFADDRTLVFAGAEGLIVANIENKPAFLMHKLSAVDVRALYAAEKRGADVQIIGAVSEPGSDEALPYLVTLAGDQAVPKLVRVPASLFYKGYGAATDSGVLFVAGTVSGVDGIYVAGPGDAPLRNLIRCSAARMPAAASGGQRLHFIAEACAP